MMRLWRSSGSVFLHSGAHGPLRCSENTAGRPASRASDSPERILDQAVERLLHAIGGKALGARRPN
jgi:hypothetical protein